jgi:hypothetical protein
LAKIAIVNEEGQNLNRYLITPTDGSTPFTADLARAADITKQGTPFDPDTMGHYVQTEDITDLSTAVQSATLGGAAVPKSGTTLQLPAYPTALPNPNALSVTVGNGGVAGSYTGAAALSISIPKITKSTTATPSYTLAEGELYFSPN